MLKKPLNTDLGSVKIILSLALFLALSFPHSLATPSAASSSSCIGSTKSQQTVIYLHGLETPGQESDEEKSNRKVLERLSQTLSLRIALPQAQDLCEGKRCWPAKDRVEALKTYAKIIKASESCGEVKAPLALLGFSNGGYFAFKIYKWQVDPRLALILASGSAGSWNPQEEKLPPATVFRLMIGQRELTLPAARKLARQLKGSLPGFQLDIFPGGHVLDYQTSLSLLRQFSPLKKDP